MIFFGNWTKPTTFDISIGRNGSLFWTKRQSWAETTILELDETDKKLDETVFGPKRRAPFFINFETDFLKMLKEYSCRLFFEYLGTLKSNLGYSTNCHPKLHGLMQYSAGLLRHQCLNVSSIACVSSSR